MHCRGSQLGAPVTDRTAPKSQLYTWLSWREDPGRPYGTAIRAGFLEHDSELALQFVEWFETLFAAEAP